MAVLVGVEIALTGNDERECVLQGISHFFCDGEHALHHDGVVLGIVVESIGVDPHHYELDFQRSFQMGVVAHPQVNESSYQFFNSPWHLGVPYVLGMRPNAS